jgi:hypothetical protein
MGHELDDPDSSINDCQVKILYPGGALRKLWDASFDIVDSKVVFHNSITLYIMVYILPRDGITHHVLPYLHRWGLLDDLSFDADMAIAQHYQEVRATFAEQYAVDLERVILYLQHKVPALERYHWFWLARFMTDCYYSETVKKYQRIPFTLRTKVPRDGMRRANEFKCRRSYRKGEIINMMRALEALRIHTESRHSIVGWSTSPDMLNGIHDLTEKGRSARKALWEFEDQQYPGIVSPFKALSRISGHVDHDTDLLTNEDKREANANLWAADAGYVTDPALIGRITKADQKVRPAPVSSTDVEPHSEVLPGPPTATPTMEIRQEKRVKSRRKKPHVAKEEPVPTAGVTASNVGLDAKLAAWAQKDVADVKKLADQERQEKIAHVQQELVTVDEKLASTRAKKADLTAKATELEAPQSKLLAQTENLSTTEDNEDQSNAQHADASDPPVNVFMGKSDHEIEVPDTVEDTLADPQPAAGTKDDQKLDAVVDDTDHAEHDVAGKNITPTNPSSAEQEDERTSIPSTIPINNPYEVLQEPSALLTKGTVPDNKHALEEPQAHMDEGCETSLGDWQAVEKRGPGRKAQRKAKREAIQDVTTSQSDAAPTSRSVSSRVQTQPKYDKIQIVKRDSVLDFKPTLDLAVSPKLDTPRVRSGPKPIGKASAPTVQVQSQPPPWIKASASNVNAQPRSGSQARTYAGVLSDGTIATAKHEYAQGFLSLPSVAQPKEENSDSAKLPPDDLTTAMKPESIQPAPTPSIDAPEIQPPALPEQNNRQVVGVLIDELSTAKGGESIQHAPTPCVDATTELGTSSPKSIVPTPMPESVGYGSMVSSDAPIEPQNDSSNSFPGMHGLTDEHAAHAELFSKTRPATPALVEGDDVSDLDQNDTFGSEEPSAIPGVVMDTTGQFTSVSDLFAGPYARGGDDVTPAMVSGISGDVETTASEGLQASSIPGNSRASSPKPDVIPDTAGLYTSEVDLFHGDEYIQVPTSPLPASDGVECVMSEADGKPWYVGMSHEAEYLRKCLQDRYVAATAERVEHYGGARAASPSEQPYERARRPPGTRPHRGFLNREVDVSSRVGFLY